MAHRQAQTAAEPGPAEVDPREPRTEPEPGELDDLVEEDLLVEDVSIDGMCGVY